jgi:two-component system CheB/CheR fusion protein
MPESESPRPDMARPIPGVLPPLLGPAELCAVGIGASAGGLEACRRLLATLPVSSNMAFIVVQHMEPTQKSLLADLLRPATAVPVVEATNGMLLERDHVYVIPPGAYLGLAGGAFRLTRPGGVHGPRQPFDFLLNSLAGSFGPRAVGVVLSGTGADGAQGLLAIKAAGGMVIAQDPHEAIYDGMPRSAIATGMVDLTLKLGDIAGALVRHGKSGGALRLDLMQIIAPRSQPSVVLPMDGNTNKPEPAKDPAPDSGVAEIIALLRAKTPHDFSLYKPGTLERRIERRIRMAGIAAEDFAAYLALLTKDAAERDALAEDLLINVTSFFRDPKSFEILAASVIPPIVAAAGVDKPIRIWVAGCASGEETYSLAMLFKEQMALMKSEAKLQVLASDADPQVLTQARLGLYPAEIADQVSAGRLARFFNREDDGYRVSSELRATVVFTVHDILADPPFSRLDLLSCRNLLIYLRPEAQAKALSIFHFALNDNAVLFLGSAETAGPAEGRFAMLSKAARLYRKIPRRGPPDMAFTAADTGPARDFIRFAARGGLPPQRALGELCRRLILERFAPAAVLINRRLECLYSTGPAERYLRIAPGYPSTDLLTLMRPGLRARVKTAIATAWDSSAPVTVPGGRLMHDENAPPFRIELQRIEDGGDSLLLICFVDEPAAAGPADTNGDTTQVTALRAELDAARLELKDAVRSLEIAGEERNAISEEALSVNEEYQSTNEELLTSKEELQSLNEELTALNSQLQETLERQRTTSNDLENVLYSTDVATLFLDPDLNIRFFTPATVNLFTIIATDIGRPLSDLRAIAVDPDLAADARLVLDGLAPIEREIETAAGRWFTRRILPYRTNDHGIEGVVITFTDITERKMTATSLEAARRDSERANIAKSRFLGAASHDLRQPLQTLALLKGLLDKQVDGEAGQRLLARLDETLAAMSGMLNTLLDINQIDAGIVQPEFCSFPINGLLDRLRGEFSFLADDRGLRLTVVPCGLNIYSDPRLIEQMLRNLLSNALKYTAAGRVVLGCRRASGHLRIEVWDTGIGMPEDELRAIFEEYHQIDASTRDRTRGLGLGLSIVQRLGAMLGHRVRVRSAQGKGSVFSIEVETRPAGPASAAAGQATPVTAPAGGTILVIEDDPDIRDLLEMFLREEGFATASAGAGGAAIELVAAGRVRPDLILADYNLPDGMNGLEAVTKLRQMLKAPVPVIILTGDISTGTLRGISEQNCTQLNKPMQLDELTAEITRLLPASAAPPPPAPVAEKPAPRPAGAPVIYVVDDDPKLCQTMRLVLEHAGRFVETFRSCEAFLENYHPDVEACLLIDAYLPGMSGLELLQHLARNDIKLPAIMITGHSDVKMAVKAMQAGASDFIEKPINAQRLLNGVDQALEQAFDMAKRFAWREAAAGQLAGLTPRQRQIMEMVLAGEPSKNIAADLQISQRTVENHRAAIMAKTGMKSLPALARLAIAAGKVE